MSADLVTHHEIELGLAGKSHGLLSDREAQFFSRAYGARATECGTSDQDASYYLTLQDGMGLASSPP